MAVSPQRASVPVGRSRKRFPLGKSGALEEAAWSEESDRGEGGPAEVLGVMIGVKGMRSCSVDIESRKDRGQARPSAFEAGSRASRLPL